MKEIWKDIDGSYRRKYQVSNLGRIKSSRSQSFKSAFKGNGRTAMIIKTFGNRYKRFSAALLCGKRKYLSVHILVANAFLGPRPRGLFVLHKNGKSKQNHATNLYYGTLKQNAQDSIRHGTMPVGEKSPKAKLNKRQVMEIFLSKESQKILSYKYGVKVKNIGMIRRGLIWKSITSMLTNSYKRKRSTSYDES